MKTSIVFVCVERVIAPDVLEQPLAGDDERSFRIRYSSSSNSRLVSSISRSPRRTSRVSGLSRRSPTASEALPRGGRRRSSARIRASSSCALERLDEVVVGAAVEALDAVLGLGARGQDQDRHVALGAQRAADLDAVEARAGRGRARPGRGRTRSAAVERLDAVGGGPHLVALRRSERRSTSAISSSSSTTSTRPLGSPLVGA